MQPSVTATIIIGIALLACAIRSYDRHVAVDAFVLARVADTERAARRGDPSAEHVRVALAQCAAVRRIVDAYRRTPPGPGADGLKAAIVLHAATWADHADYDRRWHLGQDTPAETLPGDGRVRLPASNPDLSTLSFDDLSAHSEALLSEMRSINSPKR